MQEVYNDGSLGEIKPYDKEQLEKLLENKNVNHINVFLKDNNEYKEEMTEDEKIKNLELKLEERMKEIIKEENEKKEIMDLYEEINGIPDKLDHKLKMEARNINFNIRNLRKLK